MKKLLFMLPILALPVFIGIAQADPLPGYASPADVMLTAADVPLTVGIEKSPVDGSVVPANYQLASADSERFYVNNDRLPGGMAMNVQTGDGGATSIERFLFLSLMGCAILLCGLIAFNTRKDDHSKHFHPNPH